MRTLRRGLSGLTYHALRLTSGARQGLRILTYHRVTDAHPGDRLCVPVARFDEQMRHLHEAGYRTVRFADGVRWVGGAVGSERAQGRWPERAVVLTFDDGFEDNYRYAASAMARYGFTGCFFIPAARVQQEDHGHSPDDRPMSWAQLHELLDAGHEIGAHSITHVQLTTIPPALMRQEVRGSKALLEDGLKRPVEFFCYPSGDYNDAVKAWVQESGYRAACTVEPGANHPGQDPFALRRTEVSGFDTRWDFEKKLAGAYDWLHRAVQWTTR